MAIKSYFGETFEFLTLSKIIENYRKLSKITPEIIVIDKQNLYLQWPSRAACPF
jgi:hypothetical protein